MAVHVEAKTDTKQSTHNLINSCTFPHFLPSYLKPTADTEVVEPLGPTWVSLITSGG